MASNEEIKNLFFSKNSLCPEGRVFLSDRGLSIPVAQKHGIASHCGQIYFMYQKDGQFFRWKSRSIFEKKDQRFGPAEGKEKMPFFNQILWSNDEFLVITEGEFDCIAGLQLLGENVVSLPNGAAGAKTAFRDNYEYLQRFKSIYICFDNDEPGEKAAKEVMGMISPAKYRRINLPSNCKDLNEWIQKNPEVEKSDFEHLMRNSSRIETPAFTSMAELPDHFYEAIDLGISSPWGGLNNILHGLRRGELTIITADTGAGKTTFCLQLFYYLASRGHGVWLNSYEMKPEVVNRKLASQVLQKLMKFQKFTVEEKDAYLSFQNKNNCRLNLNLNQIDLKTLRDQFELAALAYDVKYIFLDHFDYIWGKGSKSERENIDEAIREIHTLALQFNMCVFLVVHPIQKRDKEEINMNELKGSSSIKQYADNILILTRMERIDPTLKTKVKVKIYKNRLMGIESSFYLRYLPETDSFEEWDQRTLTGPWGR